MGVSKIFAEAICASALVGFRLVHRLSVQGNSPTNPSRKDWIRIIRVFHQLVGARRNQKAPEEPTLSLSLFGAKQAVWFNDRG